MNIILISQTTELTVTKTGEIRERNSQNNNAQETEEGVNVSC